MKKWASGIKGAIIIEGHVQGLANTRSFGEAGIPVIVIDKNNCIARYSKYCTGFFYCPDYLSDGFASFLIQLAKNENLHGWILLPSNDHAVFTISLNKEELTKYYSFMIPGIGIYSKIYDKSKLLEIAAKREIPIPMTENLITEEDIMKTRLSFPVITRGCIGLSFYKIFGTKAIISNNPDELRKNLRWIKSNFPVEKTFTQEIIPCNGKNLTISLAAFCINGEIKSYWIGEKVREHPLRFGTATFARSIFCERLYGPSAEMIRELNYSGVCEIEYILDPRDGNYKLIEINARTWLWVSLARECGINFPLLVYKFLTQADIEYPVLYTPGINWVNHLTDLPYSTMAILQGKLHPKQYIASFKGKTIDALFTSQDFKPGIMFTILSLQFLLKR